VSFVRNQKVLSLLVVLLIAATFLSCKSPISPTPAGPTLTLTLPDSARALDSVTFRAHYSDSIKPTWDYAWQFGDSAKATTRDTSITHIYDSAGTYTVQVALTDTVLHQTIAKQTGQIKIMPLNAPTLTLTVPDTNYWGDSCVMSVSSSQPLKPGWKFSWTLGDSTTVTGVDSVLHYYLTPGNYKVTVSLNDTVHHILLASKSATVPVVPRHFNLALLQTMRNMDIIIHAPDSNNEQNLCQPPNIVWDTIFGISIDSISWNQSGFSQAVNAEDSGFQSIRVQQRSLSANTDSLLTQINYTESDYNLIGYQSGGPGSSFCRQEERDQVSLIHIPFVFESDTGVVFKLVGQSTDNCNITINGTTYSIGIDNAFNARANWNNTSYVIIRFHK
jgi:hypothetical protein